jgi:predicted metalloprotease with PDZ domain
VFSLELLIPNSKFLIVLLLLTASASLGIQAQEPITYRFTFPAPEHRWMQVEAHFPGLGTGPLELRMSVSSPGRYSSHDFAKNVYDVIVTGASGTRLTPGRPDADGWTVVGHGGSATVSYKVFGDRVDGTYLGIDRSHAHLNMPAALMWARGLEERPARLVFEKPVGHSDWEIATQLFPGSTPLEFTAPNLHYLMDSPVEFGPIRMREFQVDGTRIRIALHHDGVDAELDAYAADVERIVRAQGRIFGEYPAFEPGAYTFLADYLPYASGDGMEHRNSTVLTSSSSLRSNRVGLLGTVAHEFFHVWNVERIRPRSLEPFDFERTNTSGELWLGEGFTQYYGVLTLARTGLRDAAQTASAMNGFVQSVSANPARQVRSAVEMSRMAPFVDGGTTVDRTNWSTTFISYYSYGAAIALGLDLTLRARSNGAVSLDDYMRALWRVHGAPGGPAGTVLRPYTLTDAEAQLAEVSRDAAFARDFFARFIEGHEALDYQNLLARAGFVLRPARPGRAWIGDLRVEERGAALRVVTAPSIGSPAYQAGLAQDDEVREIDGRAVRSSSELADAVDQRRPGDRMTIGYVDRTGAAQTATVVVQEDPAMELLPAEGSGGTLTDAQRAFRRAWLN